MVKIITKFILNFIWLHVFRILDTRARYESGERDQREASEKSNICLYIISIHINPLYSEQIIIYLEIYIYIKT